MGNTSTCCCASNRLDRSIIEDFSRILPLRRGVRDLNQTQSSQNVTLREEAIRDVIDSSMDRSMADYAKGAAHLM